MFDTNQRTTRSIPSHPAVRFASVSVAFLAGFMLTTLTAEAETPQDIVHDARDSAQRDSAVVHALDQSGADQQDTASPVQIALEPSKTENKPASSDGPSPAVLVAAKSVKPVRLNTLPDDWETAGLDISKAKEVDGKLVQELASGLRVTFTADPNTQNYLTKLYKQYKIPYGGLTLLEPDTGRVIAMISQRHDQPDIGPFALSSHAPSASVFKVITLAALLEDKKLGPNTEVCYHGGRSRLTNKNIEGDPKLDTRCGDLSDAMAWSINSLIAKLAYKHLSQADLDKWAKKFAYNEQIPFEVPVDVSLAESIADRHERSRMAAGFWHSHLSSLHGAMIGAAVQNGGVMMQPTMIEKVETADGKTLLEFEPKVYKRVMKKKTASQLKAMMSRTTKVGTARKYFRFRKEFPGDISTGGKTGTLSRKEPSYLGYTWFVGFGEDKEDSTNTVSVGGLVCNKPLWHIKGPYAASEGIRYAIVSERKKKKAMKSAK